MRAVEGVPLLLLLLGGVVVSLPGAPRPGASSHSMRFFKVSVSEPGLGLPRFIIVGYLDNQRFFRYDSDTGRTLPQVPWIKKLEEENRDYWRWQTDLAPNVEQFFKDNLWKRHNHSKGFHTWQWTHSCELGRDGHKRGFYQFGYDGKDFLSLDTETLTWTAADASALVTKQRWEAEPDFAQRKKHYLEKECIEWLQKFLAYGKETLLRKESPMVTVARKKGYDGWETLICKLYGFYPKDIEVTWLKDGEDRMPETLTGGVVPNSDGTYNMWLSINVDPKERDHYRCRVGHDSLQGPLDLAWEEPASVCNVGLIVGVILGVVVALVLVGALVIFFLRKPQKGSYQGALTSG